jgi:hypothetical protein
MTTEADDLPTVVHPNTVSAWKHRALVAEAEVARLTALGDALADAWENR